MNNQDTLIFVLFWASAVILLYKWFNLFSRMQKMKKIICKCTDTTLITTYHKNIRIFYYTYTYKKEEYTTSDKMKFRYPFFFPKIKEEYYIYIDTKKPNVTINPLDIYRSKLFLLLGIILIIMPFILK